MGERFDMVVIGAGPAGEKGATQAAYFGKRVAIVERAPSPGGAAVGNAGIPTKTLRDTALYVTGFRQREVYGLSLGLDRRLMLERLRSRAEQVVEAMTEAVRANIDRHRIELVTGTGRLGPGRTVVVSGADGSERSLEADVILLATGSRPLHPAGIPFDDPDVHDSQTILGIDRIPDTMVVVGGGPVGCEYASIFTALGVDVTLVDGGDRLLPFLDGEISDLLAASLRDVGMRLVLRTTPAAIERDGGRLLVRLPGGEALHTEKVLFAAGRAGNTEDLRLGEAGVEMDGRGRVVVDQEYRTSAPGVYAAGDVIGPPALASVSMEQARVATCIAFGIPFKEVVDPATPYGVYSIPEVAMVGMTEEAARAAGVGHQVGRGWFAKNSRAVIGGSTEGLIKLVFRSDDRRLLGVHILGEIAAELVHQGQAVLHEGGTIDRFIDATYNVPTRSDAYKYAAYDGLQQLSGRILR